MGRADLMDLVVAERTDLAEYLGTLTREQWEEPSLCAGWRVRDVVAHAIGCDELTWPGFLRRAARSGFRLGAVNELILAESRSASTGELLERLRANLRPTGPITIAGGMVAFLDGLIHHQDIRRPLGHPREIPPERLRAALDLAFKAPPVGAKKRAAGLRVAATDLDWSRGEGPEVRGPAEALLMTLAGRSVAFVELDDEGRSALAARL
ncbi:maleylpyruvate isomerase family mycothiol-dependent enzyme [Saccharopolyspora sp. TS4A08]|uniref:Maleylpyruvate isomerase family mycothiol-dependent enzyme n=1 Tax=Saccharopolyspora ipomoeae TaxID=3042027 RepID=A0ABT6PHS0_9PSEU|nr:maleylpyruvate isomerase family mycothiol-dependent enzyme [Saccharopolyspora sp. TS4A08]MDI2027544.1 maleylpyruvate isomerase family mycothiol-dependent enzyme [Saccharopolyspora sp. TS4A08]